MKSISVIVPFYNEGKNVIELHKSISSNLEGICEKSEIILIDDGSSDDTWKYISDLCLIKDSIKGIKLSKNYGQHYAITAGLRYSTSEFTIVMDGDFQDRPEVIPALIRKIEEGFDIVFVNRKGRPETIIYRIFQYLFYKFLNLISGINLDRRQANFSIINRKVVEAFNKFEENSRFYPGIIKLLGFNRTDIDASHGIRNNGKSKYSVKSRINLAIDIILTYSDKPLRFAILLGLFMATGSFILSVHIILKYFLYGFTVTGWASIIVSIFFSSGIILINLGIIGMYLGRVTNEVRKRPIYMIDEARNLNFN